ncbi:hypothetical protein COCCADRAFT_109899 [Bipolaris zeicola 26-R-13]|uniref:Uncharacterized protein n=1 Tax=Cochliobolus carbonum (strain 26-R-13) TaxID=930089 RepID=W6XS74_COCC2|nr:uncharacterized protein COCCADRAFT_109899 [Bipolaris zeicola 26-R-13]EUC28155.1 hypothetical protein COCCADRAFT_109899 [Bipolaris zeicola 26-R-13]
MFVYVVCLGVCQPPLRSIPVFFETSFPSFPRSSPLREWDKKRKERRRKEKTKLCMFGNGGKFAVVFIYQRRIRTRASGGRGRKGVMRILFCLQSGLALLLSPPLSLSRLLFLLWAIAGDEAKKGFLSCRTAHTKMKK